MVLMDCQQCRYRRAHSQIYPTGCACDPLPVAYDGISSRCVGFKRRVRISLQRNPPSLVTVRIRADQDLPVGTLISIGENGVEKVTCDYPGSILGVVLERLDPEHVSITLGPGNPRPEVIPWEVYKLPACIACARQLTHGNNFPKGYPEDKMLCCRCLGAYYWYLRLPPPKGLPPYQESFYEKHWCNHGNKISQTMRIQ